MDKAPSKVRWQRVALEYVALDYLTCKLHCKDDVFGITWEHFFVNSLHSEVLKNKLKKTLAQLVEIDNINV